LNGTKASTLHEGGVISLNDKWEIEVSHALRLL